MIRAPAVAPSMKRFSREPPAPHRYYYQRVEWVKLRPLPVEGNPLPMVEEAAEMS